MDRLINVARSTACRISCPNRRATIGAGVPLARCRCRGTSGQSSLLRGADPTFPLQSRDNDQTAGISATQWSLTYQLHRISFAQPEGAGTRRSLPDRWARSPLHHHGGPAALIVIVRVAKYQVIQLLRQRAAQQDSHGHATGIAAAKSGAEVGQQRRRGLFIPMWSAMRN